MKTLVFIHRSFSVGGLLLITILFSSSISFSQNPLVKEWDYRFGGTYKESLTSFQQTADGGYILGGYSTSNISGDKTQPSWGGGDYWIVKIDALGNIQWDKDFGGTVTDYLTSLQQTADGGYILGGTTSSGIGGNKTQASWGLNDFWVLKLDSLGDIQWDKDYGGTNWDNLLSLQQTGDGGYILGGYSMSGIGGNKTQASWGGQDYWIVKIDSVGNFQWDKDFGGTEHDFLFSLQQTFDGGYIVGGYSLSGISGNKTQPTWGGPGDYWIVKIDALGNFQWDKDFGGTGGDWLYSLQQTSDGGYILGGHSNSGISGNKTQALWGGLDPDYWIVKIDSLGNIEWDKDFGGTDQENAFGNATQTSDGGYLIAGTSTSDSSGNKTEDNLGGYQTWIVKTNALGNLQWDKTIFILGSDGGGLAIQTMDGCYAIASSNAAGIGGYKTQPAWSPSSDYWIVKFCEGEITSTNYEYLNNAQVLIFPNPFTTSATITLNVAGRFDFILYDVFGREVFKSQIINSQSQIERGNLPAGVYFYKVEEEACPPDRRGKMISSGKVVIQ